MRQDDVTSSQTRASLLQQPGPTDRGPTDRRPPDPHRPPARLDAPKRSYAVYPVGYGYLEDTTDGEGVDVFVGEARSRRAVAVFLTADLDKRDVEVNVLVGSTREETDSVRHLLAHVLGIGGLLVPRTP